MEGSRKLNCAPSPICGSGEFQSEGAFMRTHDIRNLEREDAAMGNNGLKLCHCGEKLFLDADKDLSELSTNFQNL